MFDWLSSEYASGNLEYLYRMYLASHAIWSMVITLWKMSEFGVSSYFPVFGLIRFFPYSVWFVFSRISTEYGFRYRKIRTRKTQNSDPFHAAFSSLEVDWCKVKFKLTRHKFLYLKLFSTIKENHLYNHVSLQCFTWVPTFGVCGIVNPNFPLIYKFSRCLEFFTELFVPMQPLLFSYISKFVSDLIVCFKGLF